MFRAQHKTSYDKLFLFLPYITTVQYKAPNAGVVAAREAQNVYANR